MIRYLKRCIRKCKRTMYLGSLYMRLLGTSNLGPRRLNDCNHRLHLTRANDALQLPGIMAETIWSNPSDVDGIRYLIKAGKMEEAITKIDKITPWYLRYTKDLRGDLRLTVRAVARDM